MSRNSQIAAVKSLRAWYPTCNFFPQGQHKITFNGQCVDTIALTWPLIIVEQAAFFLSGAPKIQGADSQVFFAHPAEALDSDSKEAPPYTRVVKCAPRRTGAGVRLSGEHTTYLSLGKKYPLVLSPQYLFLIMPYDADYISLHEFLLQANLSFYNKMLILAHLAQEIAKLHETQDIDGQPLAHGDLKPPNILIYRHIPKHWPAPHNPVVKLIDLGCSSYTEKITGKGSTPAFDAPEKMRSGATAATDGFSFGLIATQIVLGDEPLMTRCQLQRSNNHDAARNNIPTLSLDSKLIPDDCQVPLESLLTALLHKDSAGRPSMRKAAEFFEPIAQKIKHTSKLTAPPPPPQPHPIHLAQTTPMQQLEQYKSVFTKAITDSSRRMKPENQKENNFKFAALTKLGEIAQAKKINLSPSEYLDFFIILFKILILLLKTHVSFRWCRPPHSYRFFIGEKQTILTKSLNDIAGQMSKGIELRVKDSVEYEGQKIASAKEFHKHFCAVR